MITATVLLVLAYLFGNRKKKVNVPQMIEANFKNQYPYAEEVTWYQPRVGKFEAYFSAQEVKKSVWYNASGERIF